MNDSFPYINETTQINIVLQESTVVLYAADAYFVTNTPELLNEAIEKIIPIDIINNDG